MTEKSLIFFSVLYMMQQYICVSIYDATVYNISH